MSNAPAQDWWHAFNDLMAQIESADEPYWLSVRMRFLIDAMIDSVIASRLYQIWAALGDRYEQRPDERDEADALMRSAARQWLTVKDDESARERYLDHWQYDIYGYERD